MSVDSEILALRGGALFISISTVLLALPPALLSAFFRSNFDSSNLHHVSFFILTVGSLIWAILVGFLFQVRPSRNGYFLVLSSLILMMISWGALWNFMPTGILH